MIKIGTLYTASRAKVHPEKRTAAIYCLMEPAKWRMGRLQVGVYREAYEKPAWNPKTQEEVVAFRRRLKIDLDLPMRDECSTFVARFLE